MSIERKPNKALRVGLAAAVGFLGASGAIVVGKTLLDEASKTKVAASAEQPGGVMPTQQAFNEVVTIIPTLVPTIRSTEIPVTATSVPPTVEATKVPTKEPTKVPTIVPTIEPTKVPTIEPTKAPIIVPTKETVQEAPCGILPDKYCSLGEFVTIKLPSGINATLIGFHLPPGVPIFSKDGQVAKTQYVDHPLFRGYGVSIYDSNNPDKLNYHIIGDMKLDNMFTLDMKKGARIGQSQNTGVDMFGYNIIFYIADIGPDKREVINVEEMKKLFSIN